MAPGSMSAGSARSEGRAGGRGAGDVRGTADVRRAFELLAGPFPTRPADNTTRDDLRHGFEAVVTEAELSIPGVRGSRISVPTRDGDRVPAILLVPADAGPGPHPAVLCLHQTTEVGKDEPAGLGGDPELAYARELAARGYVTLAPDYPDSGTYRCDPFSYGYESTTMKGVVNHLAAFELLASMDLVDATRIGCLGHSLGGHNALFLALYCPQLKAVAVSCAFTAFRYYNGGNLASWALPKYMPRVADVYQGRADRLPVDFSDILCAIGPCPVWISAPRYDENFAVEGVVAAVSTARRCRHEAGFSAEAIDLVVPECRHEFPPALRRQAYEFLDHRLGGHVDSAPDQTSRTISRRSHDPD